MIDLSTFTDRRLCATLHTMTATMLDVESGALKLERAQVQQLARRADAFATEVERRGICAIYTKTAPERITRALKKRGIK